MDLPVVRPRPEPVVQVASAPVLAQVAKMAGLCLAVAMLVGAVAVASLVARGREAGPAEAAQPATAVPITGERALLPHELAKTGEVTAKPGAEPSTGRTATGSLSGPTPAPRTDDTRPASDDYPRPRAKAPTSDRDLVLEYYRLIGANPSGAFDLLAGDVFGTTLGDFQRSWSDVDRVDVLEVVDRPDGVLAVVRTHLVDGSTVRFQQVLTISADAPRRIVGARLLSVQVG